MTPKLIVEQKITAFVNKYSVFNVYPDGKKAQLIAFVQQKRFKIKEQIDFFNDEQKTQLLFSMKAEKALDIHGRYFVIDPAGQTIGIFKKDFKHSLINSTWNILDAAGNNRMTISENSQTLAILRRFVGFIPYVGDLAEIIVTFFKYHFKFVEVNGQEVGRYQKTTLIRDHYLLLMSDQAFAQYDWRLLAAQCVALDALQSR